MSLIFIVAIIVMPCYFETFALRRINSRMICLANIIAVCRHFTLHFYRL